ncbi:MAG TPA: LD-carboxypeptidase [Allosphingosinicella sp.]|nr:LD-carboxypeptidase [Allosphingosinicella sp.]
MAGRTFRIGVVAPAARVERLIVDPILEIAKDLYGREVEVRFHPSCFGGHGHFSGDDSTRAAALLDYSLSDEIDALWFGRGGYGAGRIASAVLPALDERAIQKPYLGYSDLGTLLVGLYKRGGGRIAHGPMAHDLRRNGGTAAVERALRWLVERSPSALEAGISTGTRTMAFNLTVLCHLIGTELEPDLRGHELLIEEVAEQMYRIDRSFCHLAHTGAFRRASGLRLGRCGDIIPNEPDFLLSPEEIARHWCAVAGVPFLGSADIGHDAENKVVPFGSL